LTEGMLIFASPASCPALMVPGLPAFSDLQAENDGVHAAIFIIRGV
jgi:hypothetical protein